MTNRVHDKIALITGAAGGLGRAIAQALAREGALVVLTDRDPEAAGQVAERINGELGKPVAWAARLDVTSEADWQTVLAEVDKRHGGLSVLVNNAGMVVMGSVEDLSLERLIEELDAELEVDPPPGRRH